MGHQKKNSISRKGLSEEFKKDEEQVSDRKRILVDDAHFREAGPTGLLRHNSHQAFNSSFRAYPKSG